MKPTFPILEVTATIMAAAEHQRKLAYQLNPSLDVATQKPSERLYVPINSLPADHDTEIDTRHAYLPSLTSYTKLTLGLPSKFLDPGSEVVAVTQLHRDQAQAAMEIIRNKVMIKVLKAEELNGFIKSLSKLLDQTTVNSSDIGLLTYLPKMANQYTAINAADEKKTEYMNSKPIGADGDKVCVKITVFNIRRMPEYDSILYECHDADNNLITFFKNSMAKGQFDLDSDYTITARIKQVGATKWSFGAIVNTLFYVKRVL